MNHKSLSSNLVASGFSPPAPTPPTVRLRSGRFNEMNSSPACNGMIRTAKAKKKAGNLDFSWFAGLFRTALVLNLVEAGGIEPPSASTLQRDLHA